MSGLLPDAVRVSTSEPRAAPALSGLPRRVASAELSAANAEQFAQLVRLIQLSKGRHSFGLVECNSPVLRNAVLEKLRLVFPGLHVAWIGPETYSILDFVVKDIGTNSPPAVVVTGIETLLHRLERYEPALARLNHSRDGWRQELHCPTIFWLPEFAAIALTRDCPDLLRMISSRFRFEADQETSTTNPKLDMPLRDRSLGSILDDNGSSEASDWSTVEMVPSIREGFQAFEADLKRDDLKQARLRLRDVQREVGLGLDRGKLADDSWERLIFFEKQAELAQHLRDPRLEANSWEMARRIAESRMASDTSVSCVRHAAWIDRNLASHKVRSGDTDKGLQRALRSVQILETAVENWPCEPRLTQDLATSFDLVAQTQTRLGDSQSALLAQQKAFKIRFRLAAEEPDRADYQRELAMSYDHLGELFGVLGDGLAARDAFGKSLEIALKLTQAEPDRADYLRDLSVSYDRLGDVHRALGDGAAARDAFEKSLAIDQQLAETTPDRDDYQRDLSVSFNKIGDVDIALGNVARARCAFERSLDIARHLAEANPGRTDYQRNLYVSYSKMGDLHSTLGDLPAAREAFQRSLEIAQKLAADEPDRSDYQRDFSLSLNKIGGLLRAQGDWHAALEAYQRSLWIRQEIAAAEHERADYQRDLSVSYDRMGDLQLALGDGLAARDSFQKSLDIAEKLAASEPDRTDYQRDLALSYQRIGDCELDQENHALAQRAYSKAFSIRQHLASSEPDRVDYQIELVVSLVRMAAFSENPKEPIATALRILEHLDQSDRLSPAEHPKLERLRHLMQQLESQSV